MSLYRQFFRLWVVAGVLASSLVGSTVCAAAGMATGSGTRAAPPARRVPRATANTLARRVPPKLSRLGYEVQRSARKCVPRLRRIVQRLRKSSLGQFAGGLFVDGPKESWIAIKKHPKTFVIGLCVTGLVAVGGDALALPMHDLLVGASVLAAGAEVVQIYRNEYRHARGREERARVLGKMLWLPSLVLATAVAGDAVGGPSTTALGAARARLSLSVATRSFLSAIVTGGDVPTSAITAYQTFNDQRAAH